MGALAGLISYILVTKGLARAFGVTIHAHTAHIVSAGWIISKMVEDFVDEELEPSW